MTDTATGALGFQDARDYLADNGLAANWDDAVEILKWARHHGQSTAGGRRVTYDPAAHRFAIAAPAAPAAPAAAAQCGPCGHPGHQAGQCATCPCEYSPAWQALAAADDLDPVSQDLVTVLGTEPAYLTTPEQAQQLAAADRLESVGKSSPLVREVVAEIRGLQAGRRRWAG